jgi:hypothetical protein
VVDTLFFNSGERYDIVLETKRVAAPRDYLMHVRALSPCNDTVEQFAVVRYVGDGEDQRHGAGFSERKLVVSGDVPVVGDEIFGIGSRVVRHDIVDAPVDVGFSLFFATPQVDNEKLFGVGSHTRFMGECQTI